jgi:hypothetical protein
MGRFAGKWARRIRSPLSAKVPLAGGRLCAHPGADGTLIPYELPRQPSKRHPRASDLARPLAELEALLTLLERPPIFERPNLC